MQALDARGHRCRIPKVVPRDRMRHVMRHITRPAALVKRRSRVRFPWTALVVSTLVLCSLRSYASKATLPLVRSALHCLAGGCRQVSEARFVGWCLFKKIQV